MFNLHVHLVFVTKYRRDVFNDAMLTRCEEIMRDVAGGLGAEPSMPRRDEVLRLLNP